MDQNHASNGTLVELTASLATLESKVEAALKKLAASQGRYAFDTARERYSSDQEQQQGFQEHLPVLAAAEHEAAQLADLARREARSVLLATEVEYPQLTDEEYKSAGARASIVKEDSETLSLDELTRRTRQALLADDRPAQFLYARYGRRRLASGTDVTNNTGDLEAISRQKGQLQSVITEIETRLRAGNVKTVHDKAAALMAKAHELEKKASARRRKEQRYVFQGGRDVAWEE